MAAMMEADALYALFCRRSVLEGGAGREGAEGAEEAEEAVGAAGRAGAEGAEGGEEGDPDVCSPAELRRFDDR